MANTTQTVFVTGASGYIAGHIVHMLLEKGYKVRGSVRSLSNDTKVKHLKESFPGLELVEADLLTPGSFDAGIDGCDYVMHTASPFQIAGITDPQKELVDPAVKGTENVLAAAAKAKVKRVVLTSSCAAVSGESVPDDKVHTEDDWNTDSTLETGAYRLSKTLAERRAWEITETAPFDLVVINPSFVLGPAFSSRTDSTSVRALKGLLEGAMKDGARPAGFGIVDVRDVAQAHVAAMETEAAAGRHILSSESGLLQGFLDLAKLVREIPELSAYHDALPTTLSGEPTVPVKYNHSKAERELGITFTPPAKFVGDMAKWLVAEGIVSAPGGK